MTIAHATPAPLPRIRKYEKLGFGLFLHWGLYSLLESGEWVMRHHEVDKAQYAELVKRFGAERFHADSIVTFAKECGMRYICLTTRHHDGFSLYDTRGLSEFDAPHSLAGRDLIKEFADACHRHGMPMFFYHTTLDWKVESFDHDWEGYLAYLRASVEILCKYYGKVSGFWFDGNWSRKDRDWKEDELYAMIRSYQPDCILVNNSSIGALGKRGHPELDVLTFEQGRPGKLRRDEMEKYVAAEMCETMNSHWGISSTDFSFKTPADIIRTLTACRRYGANLLLNVGPTANGEIPEYEAAALRHVGRWIRQCGASLYEGEPTELVCRGDDFVLRHGQDYYYYAHHLPITNNGHLHVGESGAGLKTIQGQLGTISGIRWVDNGEELSFSQSEALDMLTFHATANPYGSQMVVRVAQIITGN